MENESKNMYIIGTDIEELFKMCNNHEEKKILVEETMLYMLENLKTIDEKFTKKAVLYSVKEVETYHRRYKFCTFFKKKKKKLKSQNGNFPI